MEVQGFLTVTAALEQHTYHGDGQHGALAGDVVLEHARQRHFATVLHVVNSIHSPAAVFPARVASK